MKNGYIHRHEKTTGGIRLIELTPADNVAADDFSLHDPSLLWPVTFAEGAGRYIEDVNYQDGIPIVSHTLEFHTDKIDRESDRMLRSLAACSLRGLVALVTTNNNVRLLVGYSEAHGSERPLRLEKVEADTGKIHTDAGTEVIRLCCRDTAKAALLDGGVG